MHYINVHNKSDHNQEFEVHGFNNNQNIVVKAGAITVLAAPDHQSGAIIALHDGHEGEQAEITKDGFGGNDFIDMSNIVGAGGNMTVQQVGDNHTRKGDPLFMQHLNEAWSRAKAEEKKKLARSIHTNSKGHVVRIDAIKDNPDLEKFVRTFADGKTYIGVGAWGGSPGNPMDNHLSSAGQGNKDNLVTYNDGDASPSPHPSVAHRAQMMMAMVAHNTTSDAHGGPGVLLTNKSQEVCTYYFYDNLWNGNGVAGPNFTNPLKSARIEPGKTLFVSLPGAFKGRLQRGTQIPATWVEFQLDAANDHAAHGDISLEQGCDGAATIASTDGSKRSNGFVKDVIKGAPEAALGKRPDGKKVLASTMGNWMGGPNRATIEWLEKEIGREKAYVTGGTGVPDVASHNQVLAVAMY